MPPAGYPAFLQYLQSGRVSILLEVSLGRSVGVQGLVDPAALSFCLMSSLDRPRACPNTPKEGRYEMSTAPCNTPAVPRLLPDVALLAMSLQTVLKARVPGPAHGGFDRSKHPNRSLP